MARNAKHTPESSAESSLIQTPGRFAYDGLDRVLHERGRLGIMTSLLTREEGLLFADLKELCSLSDGNLNRHLSVLQEAGFIRIEKVGSGRNSKTWCVVAPKGRKMFLTYLAELERVLTDASVAQQLNSKQPSSLKFSS